MNKFFKAAILASLAATAASPALAADTSTSSSATNQEFYSDFMGYLSSQMGYFSALNTAVGSNNSAAVATSFGKFMASEQKLYDFMNTLITKA